MKQMNMGGLTVININYNRRSLPAAVQLFKPVVYKDGEIYCCLLGPDPTVGVFGSGINAKDAMNNWSQHFRKIVTAGNMENEIVKYILEKLTRHSS